MRSKSEQKAAWTESKTEHLRKAFTSVGNRYEVSGIDVDHNAGLPGTEEYTGRALAFTVKDGRRSYRVLVEDITLDEDDPSMVEDETFDVREYTVTSTGLVAWPEGDTFVTGVLQTVADRNDGDTTAGLAWAASIGQAAFYDIADDGGVAGRYFETLAAGAPVEGFDYDHDVGPVVDRVEDALIAFQNENREPSDDSHYNR